MDNEHWNTKQSYTHLSWRAKQHVTCEMSQVVGLDTEDLVFPTIEGPISSQEHSSGIRTSAFPPILFLSGKTAAEAVLNWFYIF